MYSFTKKEQKFILSLIVIVTSLIGYKMVVEKKSDHKQENSLIGIEAGEIQSEEDPQVDLALESTEEAEEDKIIMVHISGQVHNPGLLELTSGDRINDAVELSGGLKNEADTDRINLSKKVQDEEKIYIPKIGEEVEPIQISQALGTSESSASNGSDDMVDINNCTKELLVTLPGIGDITAEKIIKYREEFKFQKIEDIMEVSGIGDKKFEAMKDLIVVK